MKHTIVLALLLVAGSLVITGAQSASDTQQALKRLFPSATAFLTEGRRPAAFQRLHRRSEKRGENARRPRLLDDRARSARARLRRPDQGPCRHGHRGVLTGIIVADHHEPYGNFSIDTPQFSAQFKGKSIRDPFKVGSDIDAISRATISVTTVSRSVRNTARRVARAAAHRQSPRSDPARGACVVLMLVAVGRGCVAARAARPPAPGASRTSRHADARRQPGAGSSRTKRTTRQAGARSSASQAGRPRRVRGVHRARARQLLPQERQAEIRQPSWSASSISAS